MVHSYPPGFWPDSISKGFQDRVKDFQFTVDLRLHYFPYEELRQSRVVKSFKQRSEVIRRFSGEISKQSPDLVILCDDEASEALAVELAKLGLPLMFIGISSGIEESWRQEIQKLNVSEVGVYERYPAEAALNMLLQVAPNVKSMSIISSDGRTSELVSEQIANVMRQGSSDSTVRLRQVYLLREWTAWQRALREIDTRDQAAWLLVPYEVYDESGRMVSVSEIGKWVRENTKIPLMGIIPNLGIYNHVFAYAPVH